MRVVSAVRAVVANPLGDAYAEPFGFAHFRPLERTYILHTGCFVVHSPLQVCKMVNIESWVIGAGIGRTVPVDALSGVEIPASTGDACLI